MNSSIKVIFLNLYFILKDLVKSFKNMLSTLHYSNNKWSAVVVEVLPLSELFLELVIFLVQREYESWAAKFVHVVHIFRGRCNIVGRREGMFQMTGNHYLSHVRARRVESTQLILNKNLIFHIFPTP